MRLNRINLTYVYLFIFVFTLLETKGIICENIKNIIFPTLKYI